MAVKDGRPKSAPRRQARRIATERSLVAAVGAVLRRDGMDGLGVNAVAAEAGVDKKLIYRYFGGLPGLLRAFGESADFWPGLDELLGPDRAVLALPTAEMGAEILRRHAAGLRRRPLTLELLAWECGHRNALTTVLEDVRQEINEALIAEMLAAGHRIPRAGRVLSSLFAAAMNYLAARGRDIARFGDVTLDDDGWDEIGAVVGAAFASLLDARPEP